VSAAVHQLQRTEAWRLAKWRRLHVQDVIDLVESRADVVLDAHERRELAFALRMSRDGETTAETAEVEAMLRRYANGELPPRLMAWWAAVLRLQQQRDGDAA